MRVECDEEFSGTGFFVTPNELLTCAHVVHEANRISVGGDGWEAPAEVVRCVPEDGGQFYPLPDIALLRVDEAPDDQPCVRLDPSPPAAGKDPDILYLDAYCKGEHAPGEVKRAPASLNYVGILEGSAVPIYKLGKDQILRGYSGCPALNLTTGSVCALIESSRGEKADIGGFGVPMAIVAEEFAELTDLNKEFHATDRRWEEAREEEEKEMMIRAGAPASLPLLRPLLPLNWETRSPKSDLLKPCYGVVGLHGRERLQAELMRWRESADDVAIAVVTGDGGYGKTRLAIEECIAAEKAHWTSGFLRVPADGLSQIELGELRDWPARMLIAIDYAETKAKVVAELLRTFTHRDDGPAVRLLLICRQPLSDRELERRFALGQGRELVEKVLRRSEPVRLDRQQIDAQQLFEESIEKMAPFLTSAPCKPPFPTLVGDQFTRPLFVLAAAMLWLEDPSIDVAALDRESLMLEVIDRHESEYWQHWTTSLGLDLDHRMQCRAVAAAALLGADRESEALALVEAAGLPDLSAERRRDIARWLSHLYGDGQLDQAPAVSPLEPDSLAEALIAREYAEPELLTATLTKATQGQLENMHTVLTRVDENEGPSTFSERAADVYARAVDRYKDLVGQDPERYLPDLAIALDNLSNVLKGLGRREEAVEAMAEAVVHRRTLANG